MLHLHPLRAAVRTLNPTWKTTAAITFCTVMSFRRLRSQTESIDVRQDPLLKPSTDLFQSGKYRDLFNNINQSLQRISKVLREEKVSQEDLPRLESSLQILRVFIVEAASHLSDWTTVLATIEERYNSLIYTSDNLFYMQEASRSDRDSLETYEAFADALVRHNSSFCA